MSDILRAALVTFAVVAAFGGVRPLLAVLGPGDPSPARCARTALAAALVALAVFGLAALAADPFLDAIDVSGPSFQFAAAAAMTPLAGKLLLDGDSAAVPERQWRRPWLLPVGFPLIANPSAVLTMIALAGRYGEADALLGAAVALAPSAAVLAAAPLIVRHAGEFGAGLLGRLSGAFLVAVAVSLAVSGVRSV